MTTETRESDDRGAVLLGAVIDGLVEAGLLADDDGTVEAALRSVRAHRHVDYYHRLVNVNVEGDAEKVPEDVLTELYSEVSWPTTLSLEGPVSCVLPYAHAAQLLVALGARPGHRVLEIGTQPDVMLSTMLAEITGVPVATVGTHPQLTSSAKRTITRLGLEKQIELVETGGYDVPTGPWDRIISAAGIPGVPDTWLGQLAPDGSVLAPVAAAGEYGIMRITRDPDGGEVAGRGLRWLDTLVAHGALAHAQERRLDQYDGQGPFGFTGEPAVVHEFSPPLEGLRAEAGLHALVLVSDPRAGYRVIDGHEDAFCALRLPSGETVAFTPAAVLAGVTEHVPRQPAQAGDEPRVETLEALTASALECAELWEKLGRPGFEDWACRFRVLDRDAGRWWVPHRWRIDGPEGTHELDAT